MKEGGPLLGKRLPHLLYGGDYSPDQWPEAVWPEDVRLMREAGVNLVSLGIFAWSRLEPKEGKFDFDWLDRIMNLLHEGGVSVDLATATASPPPWLSHAHPEMLPELADGVRLWPGGRQHYCPSSPIYRDATRRLVNALASRYAKHPALAMWHVGNEYACHVPACYCDVSARSFRQWLEKRYGSVDELNRAWGADFWSQRYSEWDEILPPRRTPTWPNPSHQLDFMRFSSDELLECYEVERAVLTARTPGIPVTTNFMRFFKPLDYWKWAEREDIVSDDVYQDPLDPEAGMRFSDGGRPHALAGSWPAVDPHGADTQSGQLARGERAQGPGPDAPVELPGCREGRGRRDVFPVAAIASRRREVPQRDGPARPRRIVTDVA